ncbi:MAG: DNA-directed RNA polymerase subunit omega [Ignavibacteriae bacterium]|nr:MAG: DNA-directed RNA polymerase subunit omega [Ignavibacteriota bacterium]
MAVKPINLKELKASAENIYEAIIVSGLEARKINEENKTEFNALMNTFIPSTDDEYDERDNAEQEKISVEFEKREKPHLQALEKMADKEIEYRYKTDE